MEEYTVYVYIYESGFIFYFFSPLKAVGETFLGVFVVSTLPTLMHLSQKRNIMAKL